MAVPLILSEPFINYIYPFILVFAIIFAILQKTKVLGEGKKQIDAIVALVVGLVFIAYSNATGIVTKLLPVLAVLVVVLLIILMLTTWVRGDEKMGKGLKIFLMIIIFLVLIGALLWATGLFDKIVSFAGSNPNTGNIGMNVLVVVIFIAAVIAVLWGSGKGEKKD